jgi:hypothetical protein
VAPCRVAASAWFARLDPAILRRRTETGDSYHLTCRPGDAPRFEVEAFNRASPTVPVIAHAR